MDQRTLPGEYYLQGVREMASGFLLQPEGAFKFFFSYGALDRYGSGKWNCSEKNEAGKDMVFFQSGPKPRHDFALLESKTVAGDLIYLHIKDNNQTLIRHVYGSLQKGAEGTWMPANTDGDIIFPKQEIDTVSLIFEFSPERFSIFNIIEKTHNDFIFRFEPWIMEVFLDGFSLRVDKSGLYGRHPVLDGEKYRYEKQ